jgi:hypothetical protein
LAAVWRREQAVTISLTAILPRNAVADSLRPSRPPGRRYYKQHRAVPERPNGVAITCPAQFPDASDGAARAQQVQAEIAAPFAEVARSSDSVSAKKGGELGEWKK